MTAPDSATRHLILETANHPVDIGRVNDLLEEAGAGRPLGGPAPGAGTGELVRVPLAAGAEPAAVRDALLRLHRDGTPGVPTAAPDVTYSAATVDEGAHKEDLISNEPVFGGFGKKTGFAVIAWDGVPPMAAAPAWSGTGRRPVVALLDTEIHEHGWLTAADGDQPVWRLAEWDSPLLSQASADEPDFGSHYGHATFIAGRLRLAAPAVEILSFPVMTNDGKVNETVLVRALQWLVDHEDVHVDLVVMAFGRLKEPADETSPEFAAFVAAVRTLSGRGVTVVAAAGNSHSEAPVVPASLAGEPGLRVVSVGAGTDKDDRDPFSNFGDWVQQWRPGTDLVSLMPLQLFGAADGDGYARWSGTSFSAADYAGHLASHG